MPAPDRDDVRALVRREGEDPDTDTDTDTVTGSAPRRFPPVPWSHLGLVVIGGAVGTAGREGLAVALGPQPVPLATLAVNLVGAFGLGLLLGALAARGPDEGRRRGLRLLLGTGVLGGFTTYSALATDTLTLAIERPLVSAGYAALTLVCGLLAAWLGLVIGAGRRRSAGPAGSGQPSAARR